MFNEIIIIGRLANKPLIKQTQNGVKLATIVLDVERPYRNNLGIKDHDYINCILWKGLALKLLNTKISKNIEYIDINSIFN